MTTTDGLLLAAIVLLGYSVLRADSRHRHLMRLLNDLATMLGDAFDEIVGRKG